MAGEAELKNGDGAFLLDADGKLKICGDCCGPGCCTQDEGAGDTCDGVKCGECTSIGDGVTPTGFAVAFSGVTDCGGTTLPENLSRYSLCFAASVTGGSPDDPGDWSADCTWSASIPKSTEIGGSGNLGIRITFGHSASLGWTLLAADGTNSDTIFFASGITWNTCCPVNGQSVSNSISSCGANQVGKNGSAAIWSCTCVWRELEEDCAADEANETCSDPVISSNTDMCLLECVITGVGLCAAQTCLGGPGGTALLKTGISGVNGTHTLTRTGTTTGSYGVRDVYMGIIEDAWTMDEYASFIDCVVGPATPCTTTGDVCIRVVIENGIWVRQFQVTGVGNDLTVAGTACSYTTGACSGGKILIDTNGCTKILDIATNWVDGNRLGVTIPTTSDCQCFFASRELSGTGSMELNLMDY